MQAHTFKPQAASDEILRQADKIDNLIPRLDNHETARALLSHTSALRVALTALESKSEALIKQAEEHKAATLERFFDE